MDDMDRVLFAMPQDKRTRDRSVHCFQGFLVDEGTGVDPTLPPPTLTLTLTQSQNGAERGPEMRLRCLPDLFFRPADHALPLSLVMRNKKHKKKMSKARTRWCFRCNVFPILVLFFPLTLAFLPIHVNFHSRRAPNRAIS